jgi:hypothetical protein
MNAIFIELLLFNPLILSVTLPVILQVIVPPPGPPVPGHCKL